MENMEYYLESDGQRDSKFYIGDFTLINEETNDFIEQCFGVLENDYFYMNDSDRNERRQEMFNLMRVKV